MFLFVYIWVYLYRKVISRGIYYVKKAFRRCKGIFNLWRVRIKKKMNLLNEEEEEGGGQCPICLDNIYDREFTKFACKRHKVHIDCYN